MSIQLQHHLEHLALYSLIVWQTGLILFLLLRYLVKRLPKRNIVPIPYGQTGITSQTTVPQQNDLRVIDVAVNKNIVIEKADSASMKTDETVKGKVKTQKNKLKELRK